jgi:RING-type zinc-finger
MATQTVAEQPLPSLCDDSAVKVAAREPEAAAAPGKVARVEADTAFECNVCLELASEPVVTLCGHLYCWPCLYRCAPAALQPGRRGPEPGGSAHVVCPVLTRISHARPPAGWPSTRTARPVPFARLAWTRTRWVPLSCSCLFFSVALCDPVFRLAVPRRWCPCTAAEAATATPAKCPSKVWSCRTGRSRSAPQWYAPTLTCTDTCSPTPSLCPTHLSHAPPPAGPRVHGTGAHGLRLALHVRPARHVVLPKRTQQNRHQVVPAKVVVVLSRCISTRRGPHPHTGELTPVLAQRRCRHAHRPVAGREPP